MAPPQMLDFRPESLELSAIKDSLERMFLQRFGERVNLSLTPDDVHDPTELTNYLAGYRPFTFRAEDLSPVVRVTKDSDKHRDFSSDDAFEQVNVKTSLQGPVPEVDPRSSLSQYTVIERAAGSFVPQQTEMNEGPGLFRARAAGARRCRWAISLDIEVDVLGTGGLLSTNTNFAAEVRVALVGGQEWDGGASSDPILDLQTLTEKTAQPIAAFAMNTIQANAFVRHPKVKDHYRMYRGDAPLADAINQLGRVTDPNARVDFEVPGVGLIMVVQSKVKGATTKDYILPTGTIVAVSRPTSDLPTDGEEIATSYTFRRVQPSGQLFEAREFRVEGRGSLGGTMVVIAEASHSKMVGTDVGGIITGAHT